MKSNYTEKLKNLTGSLSWKKQKGQLEDETDFASGIKPRRLYMFTWESNIKSFGTQYAFLCTRETLDAGATLFWIECQQTPVHHNKSVTDNVKRYIFRRKDVGEIEFYQKKEIVQKEELNNIPSMLGVRKIDFVFELDSAVKSPSSLIIHTENILARNIICEIDDDGTTQLNVETWARSITVAHPMYVSASQREPSTQRVQIREPKEQRFEVCNEIAKSTTQRPRKSETKWLTDEEIDVQAGGDIGACSNSK
ncbi:hypothetical protein SCHPADRAFT_894375 [Schizopora paradoxa]|uniref:Uncharacterized protein n=1 Tax=Schizopora paradoxa TaxID=27342 RepID=A0A0H2RSG8_9AGAM|nr:hypothetical protein SCHPADRAFT_894375 [Schizopora paradoxa]